MPLVDGSQWLCEPSLFSINFVCGVLLKQLIRSIPAIFHLHFILLGPDFKRHFLFQKLQKYSPMPSTASSMILFHTYVFFFFLATTHFLQDLSFLTGIKPKLRQWKFWVLTTGPPDKSRKYVFHPSGVYLCVVEGKHPTFSLHSELLSPNSFGNII